MRWFSFIRDLDWIQTSNLLSRNQMRYSIAPRGHTIFHLMISKNQMRFLPITIGMRHEAYFRAANILQFKEKKK